VNLKSLDLASYLLFEMNYRILGKTNLNISEISLGTWQVGGKWGDKFNHDTAEAILNKAIDSGINFIDTADVYSDGDSEKAVGKVIKSRSEKVYVATKCGRKLSPHTNEAYTPQALRKFVEDSLTNMGLETIDLIQLHCPPTEVFYRSEIFELFDRLKDEGKIQHLGVSIEKIEEGLQAITYSNVCSVQLIYNIFRQKPNDVFLKEASKQNVGIIARVPLASGLLSGKFNKETKFSKEDHRNFNRDGAAFDKGETFSGINYDKGLAAVEELKLIFPETDLALIALKWILESTEVSCVIPGASHLQQLENNLKTESLKDLNPQQLESIKKIYLNHIYADVHHLW
jgi:aryl-alcohol dehydrogenase-like predicted oxidoreductase